MLTCDLRKMHSALWGGVEVVLLYFFRSLETAESGACARFDYSMLFHIFYDVVQIILWKNASNSCLER